MSEADHIARLSREDLPRHIAIIMDGNGRWARQRGQARALGHRAGVKSTRAVIETCAQMGIQTLTLFAFSSENWNRPADEVSSLMSLFLEVLQREVDVLHKNDIRVRFVGERSQLSERLQKRLIRAEAQTADNQRMELVLAVAYGGRWDIVNATQQIAAEVQAGRLTADAVDENLVASHLSLRGLEALDLLIRTGGERRISNFLLWDIAYAELYFTDVLWPDFTPNDLNAAIGFFQQRQRRFGRTSDQLETV
jgi:undecaprenyl diphosphate synthase